MPTFNIHQGSNLDILPTLPDNSIDSIVTDPPYELGFMGKSWDSTGIAYNVEVWKQCLRVLKHGGHLIAFSGSRTYHRMAVAIEDAGFQIRDQMMWVYGSGFPKSHNIGKAVDKLQGNEREEISRGGLGGVFAHSGSGVEQNIDDYETVVTKGTSAWEGWGTALKPAHEPIVLARKPLEKGLSVAENVLKWGVGGINIDGCRVEHNEPIKIMKAQATGNLVYGQSGRYEDTTELKSNGRFPANLMHDGSQQVMDLFPETGKSTGTKAGSWKSGSQYEGGYKGASPDELGEEIGYGDRGSAARFFYCPKANKSDRDEGCEELPTQEKPAHMRTGNGTGETSMTDGFQPTQRKNTHPTVKPTELMRYLCRLVTPPNGTVLDPFNGSGSTGKGAILEGFNYVGIELDAEYIKISEARIKAVL